MTKDDQIANQERLIGTLNANNAGLRKKVARLERGQADLRNLLSPEIEPTTADEWEMMVRRARAEIEAEDAQTS